MEIVVFRFKKSVPLSYEQQGYIYFKSLRYRELEEKERREILDLCRRAGGEYHRALFEFVTTNAGADKVCVRNNLSRSTLERIVRKYYRDFRL